MRNLKYIISQVRKQTENEDVSDFVGISDSEFIQYLNDAQHRLQAVIIAKHPKVFLKEKIITAVSEQEVYSLPSDCYLGNKIHNIEYSVSGNEDDYYVLEETTLKRRNSGVTGSPSKYIRSAGKFLVTPQGATGGKFRLTYAQKVRELDIQRAQLALVPDISSSDQWTISLDNTTLTTDRASLLEHEYICIVDKHGKSILENIPLADINTVGTTMTLDAHTIDSENGESASDLAVGQFIVGGKDTTTHGDLPRSIERYLISYCAWKVLKRDSSVDSNEAIQELTQMEIEIIESYALISDDVQFIPQLNSWNDWSVD